LNHFGVIGHISCTSKVSDIVNKLKRRASSAEDGCMPTENLAFLVSEITGASSSHRPRIFGPKNVRFSGGGAFCPILFSELREATYTAFRQTYQHDISTSAFTISLHVSGIMCISSFRNQSASISTGVNRRDQISHFMTHRKTRAYAIFAYAGPASWNSLPDNLKNVNLSVQTFKRHLKTFFLFSY